MKLDMSNIDDRDPSRGADPPGDLGENPQNPLGSQCFTRALPQTARVNFPSASMVCPYSLMQGNGV
jgi:hypothetical protein